MLNVRILSKTIGENQQPQDLARKQNQTYPENKTNIKLEMHSNKTQKTLQHVDKEKDGSC